MGKKSIFDKVLRALSQVEKPSCKFNPIAKIGDPCLNHSTCGGLVYKTHIRYCRHCINVYRYRFGKEPLE